MSKVVLITGCSSGIGRATAKWFAEKGWNVVATMRNPEGRDTDLKGKENIDLVHLDVLDSKSVRDAVQHVRDKYNGLDVLVNNAGYAVSGIFEATTPDQARKQFDTNVLGLMDVTREVLPIMRDLGKGTIVNVTSIGGRMTFPLYSLYNSTKWAVEGFSESLYYELRSQNIRVKVIEPGVIRTDFYNRSMDVAKMDNLSSYNAFVESATNGTKRVEEATSPPEAVAECIYNAVNDGTWRLRYHAGKYSTTMLTMRRILPDRMLFALIGRTNLPKKRGR